MTSSVLRRCAVAVVLVALAGCKEESADKGGEPVRPVKVMTVAAAAETRPIRYSGSVRARVETALGFRVGGKIVERKVDVGQRVEAGRVLARLDPTDLKLSLQTAEANVVAARSRVKVAEDGRERARALAAKGFVTKAGLDGATLDADQAVAGLEAALSARDQAANQIAYADLASDADGIVTDIRADVGQVVAAGTPVVTLARDDEKEVAIAVPEQDVVHFAKDQTVGVRFWADKDLRLAGRIREIAGSADPASRTYAIRIALPADDRVRLGMTATVEADVPVAAGTIVVPLSALAEAGGVTRVWVVDRATATVDPRPVTLGAVVPEGVGVVAGLKRGDMVVTAGVQFLVPGKKVLLPGTAADGRSVVGAEN
ncbi:efflux RND transporter periplasmic adaptor subunit [Siculibacillus lacustris]|uniref:Efflux RND transporter periplasmic adaptor subunit n=1 Tax=Siculibacillus lacustris TaxID=1549641 RepID=A0A4V2KUC8_9HYPH|nr:efflux RND transporter periplasmic adaptor subunit [Siculibacillus lacustris]TBW40956.1 efflux RND transporter periplasmic adaptor subunit [Siculibacillus lacustris]